jgi:hypothetical protein
MNVALNLPKRKNYCKQNLLSQRTARKPTKEKTL